MESVRNIRLQKKRYEVKAEYLGYIDLGAACFCVPIKAFKPDSTLPNKIFFRSRIGDEFHVGKTYNVTAEISSPDPDAGDVYEVIAVHGAA